MNVWVQTRGRADDYRFFGRSDGPDRWWTPYLRLTAPEERMAIVETGSHDWRLYVTAMNSGRTDTAAPPRPIRNSLLVEGSPAEGAVLARMLTAYWSSDLEHTLQRHLTADRLDAWHDGVPPDAAEALHAALESAGTACESAERQGTWSGSPHSVAAREAFASACRGAAESGSRGVFAHLNLMSDVAEATRLPPVAGAQVCVFLYDGGSDTLTLLEAPGKRDPNPPEAGPSPQTRTGRNRRRGKAARVVLFLAILAASALACLLLFLP